MNVFYSASTTGFYVAGFHEEMPGDCIEITQDRYQELLTAQSTGKAIVPREDGTPEAIEPAAPSLSAEQRQQALESAVQRHLDLTAKQRNYDGILSLCSYVSSTIQRFADEGQAGVVFRDACWAHCYQVLADVTNGVRAEPTAAELLAELPVIQWPAA